MVGKLSAGALTLVLAAIWLVTIAASLVCCSAGMHGDGPAIGIFLPLFLLTGSALLTIVLVRRRAKS